MGLFKLEKKIQAFDGTSINYINDLLLILNARKTFQTSLNLEFIHHPHVKKKCRKKTKA